MRVHVGRADRIARMGAAVAVGLVDERALDVNTGDQPLGERILVSKRGQRREPAAHQVELLRDDRGQETAHAVSVEPLAGAVQLLGRSAPPC